MEIKILCHCGTKFKFDVEPVNGCVPFAVICPGCGVDATETANGHIAQSAAIPAAAESVESAAAQPRLRVRVNTPVAAPEPVAEGSSPEMPPMRATPRQFVQPTVTAYAPNDEGLGPKFFLGLLGGALGVLVGCAIWFAIYHLTGTNFRLLALLVGAGGGFGAKLLSKDEGSSQLGMITSVLVLVGIVLTAYFIGKDRAHNFAGGLEADVYKERVAYAKRAVQAVPDASDEEIRAFLAKEESSDSGEKTDPASISQKDVEHFRDVDLGHFKELASGKVSAKDYLKTELRWQFEEQVAVAKRAIATMPNESDAEIRLYLAQENVEADEKRDSNAVTAEEIQQFRNDTLPELKALASGEKQMDQSAADFKSTEDALTEIEDKSPWMKFLYFFGGWGLGGVGIMFITLGMTYKICTHN